MSDLMRENRPGSNVPDAACCSRARIFIADNLARKNPQPTPFLPGLRTNYLLCRLYSTLLLGQALR
jgi:hypothetical protein